MQAAPAATTRITSWEARVGDPTKSRTADDISGLPKFAWLKRSKTRPGTAHASSRRFACSYDRKISIVKRRPDHHIATEIAKAYDRRKYRNIEPTIDTADERDRSYYVGPNSVDHAVDCAVGGYDVDRVTGLRLHDRGELPTIDQPAGVERQAIYCAGDEAMAGVEA